MTYEAIEEHGGIQWPFPAGSVDPKESRRLYTDGVFPTDDGRRGCCRSRGSHFPNSRPLRFRSSTPAGTRPAHADRKTANVPILERLSPNAWLETTCATPGPGAQGAGPRGRRLAARQMRNVELRVTETIAPGQVFAVSLRRGQCGIRPQSAFDPILREPNYKQSAGWRREDGGRRMKRLVVVGNGMQACASAILKYAPQFEVIWDETHVLQPHHAVVGARGRKSADDIVLNSVEGYERHNINLRVGIRIVDVEASRQNGDWGDGSVTRTTRCSRPRCLRLPPIDGLLHRRLRFRIDDTRALLERAGPA